MTIIELIVAPNGETKVETKGFAGANCREASEFIERALGRRTTEKPTREFHETQTQQQPLQEGS